jgi:hypothetical protein
MDTLFAIAFILIGIGICGIFIPPINKLKSNIFALVLIGGLALNLFLMIYNPQSFLYQFKDKVRPGQIWVKEYDIDNPFVQPKRDTVKILDVKGEHVLFTRHGDTLSDKKYWIPVNARLIKE